MRKYSILFILLIALPIMGFFDCDGDETGPSDDVVKWKVFNKDNSGIADNYIRCVAKDMNNDIWVGTNIGLAVYKNSQFEYKWWAVYCGTECKVTCILPQIDVIWFGSINSGLHKIIPGTDEIYTYTTDNSALPSNTIYSIIYYDGYYWIGTDNGLVMTNEVEWTVIQEDTTRLPDNKVRAIYPVTTFGDNYRIYFGTHGGFAYYSSHRNNWGRFDVQNSDLPDNVVATFGSSEHTEDNIFHHDIWVGTESGLATFSIADDSFQEGYFEASYGLPDSYITAILSMQDEILIGTRDGMAFYNHAAQTWDVYDMNNSDLPDNHILCFTKDIETFWIGTANGLVVYNKNGLEDDF